jgi:hypothetical protein
MGTLIAAATLALAGTPVHVTAAFAPARVQFGDPVTARVVVVLDRDAVVSRTLRIDEGLAPLTQLAAAKTVRAVRGSVETVTLTVRAACLGDACLRARLTFPAVRVSVTRRDGRAAELATRWAPLRIGSRVTAADVAATKPRFEADTTPGPPTYRVSPSTATTVLETAAGLAAFGALVLAALQVRARLRRSRPRLPADELARALRLAREAERRPVPDRRRALGLLARVLEATDGALGRAASDLAWSEPQPEPPAIDGLVTRVEQERG